MVNKYYMRKVLAESDDIISRKAFVVGTDNILLYCYFVVHDFVFNIVVDDFVSVLLSIVIPTRSLR